MRFYNAEIRSASNGEMLVEGYVNVTGSQSRILGKGAERFIETIQKGAFKRALDNRTHDIDFLAEHNNNLILASTRNGSLELVEDSKGLFMSAKITPTTWGTDYYKLIDSGILSNMSFGFRTIKDNWSVGKDGIYQRDVLELELYEVSVVREPAYLQSSISSRDLLGGEEIPQNIVKEKKNMEDMKELMTMFVDGIRSLDERMKNVESAVAVRSAEPQKDEAPEVVPAENVEDQKAEPTQEPTPEDETVKEPVVEEVEEPTKVEEPIEQPTEEKSEERSFDMEKIREAFNQLKG